MKEGKCCTKLVKRKKGLVTRVLVEEKENGTRATWMGLSHLTLGDEWTNWHVDTPDLESDEAADERVLFILFL